MILNNAMSTIFKDVLIFRGEPGKLIIASKESLPVTVGFNSDVIIGKSNIREVDGLVYADIEIFEDYEKHLGAIETSYPYTCGFQIENGFDIKGTAIGVYPNIDETIPDLRGYITNLK